MKNLKSIFALFLTLAMIFSVAGCGEGGPEKLKPTDDDSSSALEGIEKYAGTTVTFATWVDHSKTEGAAALASFAEKYDITVDIMSVGQFEYVNKISGLVAAGQSPDVIVENGNFPALFPVAQRLDEIKTLDLNDKFWNKDITEFGSIDGVPYFINAADTPWTYYGTVIYNKKLFNDNGFKSPDDFYKENNWTIDTFVECATRISRLGSDYVGAAVPTENVSKIFGTDLVLYKDGKFINNASDDKLATAYRWLMNGVDSKIFIPQLENSDLPTFNAGKMGMVVYSDYGLRISGPFRSIDAKDLGYVPYPKVSADDKEYPVSASGRAYGICKGARNPEAAAYFLRHFLDYKNYDKTTLFVTKEAAEFTDTLKTLNSSPKRYVSTGVLDIIEGLNTQIKYYKTITQSTAAQVTTNIKTLSNNIDVCVKESNDIIDKIKNNQ